MPRHHLAFRIHRLLSRGLYITCIFFVRNRYHNQRHKKKKLTVSAQRSRGKVQSVHTALRTGRGRVVLAVVVDGSVDRLLARGHGVGKTGVNVTVGGTVLKHRIPVNTRVM